MPTEAEKFKNDIESAIKANKTSRINDLLNASLVFGVPSSMLFVANDKDLLQNISSFIENPVDYILTNNNDSEHNDLIAMIMHSPDAQENATYGLSSACEKSTPEVVNALLEKCDQDAIIDNLKYTGDSKKENIEAMINQLESQGIRAALGVSADDDSKLIREKIEQFGKDPIAFAIEYYDKDSFEQIVENYLDYQDEDGKNILTKAISLEAHDKIAMIINSGMDINFIDENAETALFHAVSNNNTDAVEILLQQGARLDIKNKDGLDALQVAIANENTDIINQLVNNGATLKHGQDQQSNSREDLDQTVSMIKKLLRADINENTKNELLAKVKIYNVPVDWLRQPNESNKEYLNKIKQFIKDPAQVLNDITKDADYDGPINDLTKYAVNIFAIQNSIAQDQRDDNETAMKDADVTKAKKFYENILKQNNDMNDRFNSYEGDSKKQKIKSIEHEVRGKILTQILDYAKEQKDNNLVQFINDNYDQIINLDPSFKDEVLSKLNRNDNSAFAAWRCFDSRFPVDPDWPNLLVEQTRGKNDTIFSTGAAGEVSRSAASDYVREMAAYAYLACMDEVKPSAEIPNPQSSEDRFAAFLIQLEMIQHAHNYESQSLEHESPSCFPGYLTRLGAVAMQHPVLQPPAEKDNPKEIAMNSIERTIRNYFNKNLNNIVINSQLNDINTKKEKMVDTLGAVTFFTHKNAKDYIADDDEFEMGDTYIPIIVDFRKQLEKEVGTFDELMEKVKQEVKDRCDSELTKQDIEHCRLRWYANSDDLNAKLRVDYDDAVKKLTNQGARPSGMLHGQSSQDSNPAAKKPTVQPDEPEVLPANRRSNR